MKLPGANMDIDLTTPAGQISWTQTTCPWNQAETGNIHRCATKNISICPYFCGISYLDVVLCSYPHQNTHYLAPEIDKSIQIEGPFLDVVAECEPILDDLSDWFGIDSANIQYLQDIEVMPTFLASLAGEIVGFLTLKIHNAASAEIHILGVLQNQHRQGIGSALLKTVEDHLYTQGYTLFQVKTLSSTHPDPNYARTRLFYEAMGFTPLEEFLTLWGEANPCLQMIKYLD